MQAVIGIAASAIGILGPMRAALAAPVLKAAEIARMKDAYGSALPEGEAPVLSAKLQKLLAHPQIFQANIGDDAQERHDGYFTFMRDLLPVTVTNQQVAEKLKDTLTGGNLKLFDTDKNRLVTGATACWLRPDSVKPDEEVLYANLPPVCAIFPDAKNGATRKFVRMVMAMATDYSPLEDDITLGHMDAKNQHVFTVFHEQYHALLRIRLEENNERRVEDIHFHKPLNEDGTPNTWPLTDSNIVDEAGGDVFWAELLYRITPSEGRAEVLEQVRDVHALRVLSYKGEVIDENQGVRTIHQHYTAPALQAWLDKAVQRDPTSYTYWNTDQLTVEQQNEVATYASGVVEERYDRLKVADAARDGRVAQAYGAVVMAQRFKEYTAKDTVKALKGILDDPANAASVAQVRAAITRATTIEAIEKPKVVRKLLKPLKQRASLQLNP